ncbi:MAG TPA: hypothetical protein P5571_12465 [Candidatus Krumholzibacteria bacterium]|nr:hypothetical protein [Candidatus Krumholzibacteria bacterium]HRX52174.1 hypothetical protein [Candidatus Krumholzibacteria bacterium]
MRTPLITLLALLAIALFAVTAQAQGFGAGLGDGDGICNFVDEDGDGFNDLAPDADGDGIPNGLDPDYVPAGDGTGNMYQWGKGQIDPASMKALSFAGSEDGALNGNGNRYGLGDGTGSGVGPADGTGFGSGNGDGDGICDDTDDTKASTLARRGGRR